MGGARLLVASSDAVSPVTSGVVRARTVFVLFDVVHAALGGEERSKAPRRTLSFC